MWWTVMRWRPILIGLLLVVPLWIGLAALAHAQDTPSAPTGDRFKELVCRMAVGNIVGRNQPMLELYGHPDGTWNTGSAYGLFTGFYIGSRGWSGHGPDLDGPGNNRFLKDGTPWTNGDAAHLRAITAEFRQGACDALPTPQS